MNALARHNAEMQDNATQRRAQIAALLAQYGYYYGIQIDIARRLGVSSSTVCRDMQQMHCIRDMNRPIGHATFLAF